MLVFHLNELEYYVHQILCWKKVAGSIHTASELGGIFFNLSNHVLGRLLSSEFFSQTLLQKLLLLGGHCIGIGNQDIVCHAHI